MKLNYYKNLDGIRAIAALMIMFFHFFLGIVNQDKTLLLLQKLSIFGQTGVTLFFVLSGFLITRILLNSKEKQGFFKNFYVRRSLRIFPLYYFFLLFSYLVYPLIFGTSTVPLSEQFYYYTYLQNFATTFDWNASGPGHFWSLAVEEHFYLFWPLIIFFFNKKNLNRIIWGIIIGALVLRFYMLHLGFEVFYFTFTRFDALAIGALLALIELKKGFEPKNALRFLSLGIIILLPTLFLWIFFTGEENFYIQAFKFDLLAFTYFALIGFILCLKEGNFINQTLRIGFLSFTGKISYGLYVYHPFAYFLVDKFYSSNYWLLNLFNGFLLSYVMATISFYLIESQFLRFKKYFTSDKYVLEPKQVLRGTE